MRLIVGFALLALAYARIGHTAFSFPNKLTDVQPVAFNLTKYIGQTVMVVAVRSVFVCAVFVRSMPICFA